MINKAKEILWGVVLWGKIALRLRVTLKVTFQVITQQKYDLPLLEGNRILEIAWVF